MSELTELREQRDTLRKDLAAVFDAAKTTDGEGGKPGYDFRKVDADAVGDELAKLEGFEKSSRIAAWVQEKTAELDDVCEKLEPIEAAEAEAKAWDEREKQIKRFPHPGTGDTGNGHERKQQKSFGRQITEHPTFKRWQEGSKDGKIRLEGVGLSELKALFQTTAGWAPESTRTGFVAEAVTRPLQILDIMPTGNTGQAEIVFMEETLRTHAAAETAEGASKPESSFELTEQRSPVQEVADSVPVTDIQLEDVAMVESYLEGRLNFGIQQRLDSQILNGDGISPNLEGILNTTGIQTQAKGTDPTPDAIFKAGTLLRVNGRVVPTHVLLHANDWQEIRLLRTSDGIYIWGSPSEAGPERIWGWPVIQNEALTEGTGLIGSFMMPWITLFERRGVVVETGFVNTQFRDNQRTIRASGRWALVLYRPAAFATVTGI